MPSKPNNNRLDRGKNRKSGNVKQTEEERRAILAKQLGLKPKTKEFVDNMLENPNKSLGEVYMMNHKTESKRNASQAASKLLKKPNVIGYKDSAIGKAKRRIVSLVDSTNESIALKASESIIDRMEGKAIQRNETATTIMRVQLDISGSKIGGHFSKVEPRKAIDSTQS